VDTVKKCAITLTLKASETMRCVTGELGLQVSCPTFVHGPSAVSRELNFDGCACLRHVLVFTVSPVDLHSFQIFFLVALGAALNCDIRNHQNAPQAPRNTSA
jgi:hypothetical protein